MKLNAFLLAVALCADVASAADVFVPTPDHERHEGVPAGKVTQMPALLSKIFPNTTRDWFVYVPAQYKPDGSAALMVFQDGQGYINEKGNWRVPIVFDNLIARGEMPVTVAVFVNPGHDPAKGKAKSATGGSNRGYEYDSLGDKYARFLLEEVLPEVRRLYPYSDDPARHAIQGSSSGGIAAFTVAWERPDQFRKVLSTVGSFVNLAGGDAYPSLIRKTERKPIRVFLQDSSGDLDNPFGNWPLANQQMYAALRYMGYDVKFDYVEGYKHSSERGGSIFPDALRWLWRNEGYTPTIVTKGDLGGDMTLHRLLIEGEGWQTVAEGVAFPDAPMTDDAGNFYFCEMRGTPPGIYKITPDGVKTKLNDESVSGMKFGPDGRVYACQNAKKRLIAIDFKTGAVEVIAEDVVPNDLVVTHRGHVFFTETPKEADHLRRPEDEGETRGGHRAAQPQWHRALAGPRDAGGERGGRGIRVHVSREPGRHARREVALYVDAAANRPEGRVQAPRAPAVQAGVGRRRHDDRHHRALLRGDGAGRAGV